MTHKRLIAITLILTGCAETTPPRIHDGRLRGKAQPVRRSTSRSTTQAVTDELVAHWVAQLGAADFEVRESAQRRLAELGDAAAPHLVGAVADPNPEKAGRAAVLLGTPTDPALRVELAANLLATTDPDTMEWAVHMLFDSPGEVCDLFMERAERARGVERVVFEPIVEQLRSWKRMDDLFQRHHARIRQEKPEDAARMLEMHLSSNLYHAEAAYWMALDALMEYRARNLHGYEAVRKPASRPAR